MLPLRFSTKFCDIPRQSPADQVEDVTVSQPGPGNLWELDSDGFWWFHSNFVILIQPEINTHFATTIPNNEG